MIVKHSNYRRLRSCHFLFRRRRNHRLHLMTSDYSSWFWCQLAVVVLPCRWHRGSRAGWTPEAPCLHLGRPRRASRCVEHCRATPALLKAPRIGTHTHTQVFIMLRGSIENCTSQLSWTSQLPKPRNTTLLHKFYLATTQILEYTPTQRLPTGLHVMLTMERGFSWYFGSTSLAASAFICEGLVARKYEIEPRNLPQPRNTTFLYKFVPANVMNVKAHTHTHTVSQRKGSFVGSGLLVHRPRRPRLCI